MDPRGKQNSSMEAAAAGPSSSRTTLPSRGVSARFDRYLLCRILYRFHCMLKTSLHSNPDRPIGKTLANLETVVRVQREFMLYIVLVLMLLSFLIGLFGRHMSNLLCIPYPALITSISMDSKISQRYAKWLSYWIIFGFVNLLDMSCPLVCKILPQYHLWRTVFLAWCFCPYKCNGCKIIRNALFNAQNMRIVRVIAYVGYEAFRVITVH